ncbi:hypothetical protein [Methylobacterium radiotolerans]|uniref:hypothetical protein n=1 Tax=Methylobacterium radiotolerans TaxID=31998 RepID=UPI001F4283DB|nr:hypothetical protein [Methylobacterium radiotolerans]UIY45576.1 hypothetical protein LZ599_31245 [Methylobacterium radiotolerans]
MATRLSRFGREAADVGSEWLRLAIVTGPFVWLPGTTLAMAFASGLDWVTDDTAYSVTCWAVGVCLVLWLPASPLVRFLIAAAFEAVRDGLKVGAWIAQKVRRS